MVGVGRRTWRGSGSGYRAGAGRVCLLPLDLCTFVLTWLWRRILVSALLPPALPGYHYSPSIPLVGLRSCIAADATRLLPLFSRGRTCGLLRGFTLLPAFFTWQQAFHRLTPAFAFPASPGRLPCWLAARWTVLFL